jgi:hypothetical protein
MRTTLKATGLIASLVLLVGCSQLFVAGQSDQRNVNSLEGVWQTVVSPRNCATGAALGPTFPGILMFSHDGTMTGTSTAVSSVYGLWSREPGSHQYSFTSLSLRYSAAGVLEGTRRITQSVALDDGGSSFTSTGTFQDSDVAGNPTISGCSTSTGTRFQ